MGTVSLQQKPLANNGQFRGWPQWNHDASMSNLLPYSQISAYPPAPGQHDWAQGYAVQAYGNKDLETWTQGPHFSETFQAFQPDDSAQWTQMLPTAYISTQAWPHFLHANGHSTVSEGTSPSASMEGMNLQQHGSSTDEPSPFLVYPTKAMALSNPACAEETPHPPYARSIFKEMQVVGSPNDHGSLPPPAPPPPRKKKYRVKNRAAAKRCRDKARQYEIDLVAREKQVTDEHAQLEACAASVKEEILVLKQQILQHSGCECPMIQGYIARVANEVGVSSPGAGPTTYAQPCWHSPL